MFLVLVSVFFRNYLMNNVEYIIIHPLLHSSEEETAQRFNGFSKATKLVSIGYFSLSASLLGNRSP
jgi:hypothetical protein